MLKTYTEQPCSYICARLLASLLVHCLFIYTYLSTSDRNTVPASPLGQCRDPSPCAVATTLHTCPSNRNKWLSELWWVKYSRVNGVYKMQVTETDGWLYQVCYMQQIDRYRHKFDWVVLLFRAASSQIKVKIKELRVISLLGNMRRADSIELENHMCIGGVHLILVCQLLSQDILHHWDRHLHEPASHAHHQQSCRKNNIK